MLFSKLLIFSKILDIGKNSYTDNRTKPVSIFCFQTLPQGFHVPYSSLLFVAAVYL